jgi:RNA 3'-phosphate cyclase
MLEIDGSIGEGGGQLLRSSLTLSLLTGRSVRVIRIRARRSNPGLRPQHLAAVKAAAEISGAHTVGARLGSKRVAFEPGPVRPGSYAFDIGSAGSSSLVLQTLLPALVRAGGPSSLTITGGTHVRWSPCSHYLEWAWLPALKRIGWVVRIKLDRAGFYPRGGGLITAHVGASERTGPLLLMERGELSHIEGFSFAGNLPLSIAERQRRQAEQRLASRGVPLEITSAVLQAAGKGTAIILRPRFDGGLAVPFGLGEPGLRAERVADLAVEGLLGFLSTEATVDRFLADQLLIPLSMADGPSAFITAEITSHLQTLIPIIEAFGVASIQLEPHQDGSALVRISPRNSRPAGQTNH